MDILLTDPKALEALRLPPELSEPAAAVGQFLLGMATEPTFQLPSLEERKRLAALDRPAFEEAMTEAGRWPEEPDWGTFAFMADVALRAFANPATSRYEAGFWKENARSLFAAFLNRFFKQPTQ